jgi:Zn-dependent protease with chaperone function
MPSHIIPYEPYHPHFGYTLTVTVLAWILVALYSRAALRHHPNTRVVLLALTIGLPIHAEGLSYLVQLTRPAPDTPVGYLISHIHAFFVERYLPIDTFLSATTSAAIVLVVTAVIAISLLRFGYGTLQLRRALATAAPLDLARYEALAWLLAEAALRLDRSPPPIFVIRGGAPLALTAGILHPRVYLSPALLDLLTPDEALAVICHEWAHVLRRDNMWNWLVRLLRDVGFFLPGSHLAWRWMIASQDEACDALAAELTRRPLSLARALVKVMAATCTTRPAAMPFATAFAMAAGSPRTRVEQMIRLSDADAPVRRWQVAGAYALGGMLLLLGTLPALLGS